MNLGKGALDVDDKDVASKSLEEPAAITLPEDETLDSGSDTRTGVALVEFRCDLCSSSPARAASSPSTSNGNS